MDDERREKLLARQSFIMLCIINNLARNPYKEE